MAGALIRPGNMADADVLAEVHVRSWQGAYRGILPDSFLDGLSVEDRVVMWRGWLARGNDVSVWVAEEDSTVVGFVSAGPLDPADEPDAAEIYALYVLPERTGHGIESALLARAVDQLRTGFRTVTLWVLEANHRARRFYESAGWWADGATKTDTIDGVDLVQVRYRLDLR